MFSYDGYGRLTSIQDVIGITSSFTYDGNPGADGGPDGGADPGDPYFITTLTTPYGTSSFTGGYDQSQNMRWLELTDPDSNTERVEYDDVLSTSIIPATEGSTPGGMTVENGFYNLHNSFHWSKYACAQGYCDGGTKDFTKASLTHWVVGNRGVPMAIAASTKEPLENRVYNTYPGQISGAPDLVGAYGKPAAVGRVLSSGSQVSSFTYNSQGNATDAVDPNGRETKYTYASSGGGTGIDLTQVQQLTASGPTYSTLASFTYDGNHNVLTATDAASQVWRYCYNAAGQTTQIVDPANYASGSSCSGAGYGAVGTRFTYDGSGRLTTVTDALGNTFLSLTYSGTCGGVSHINCDLPATVTDNDGFEKTFTRDALDRVTQVNYTSDTYSTNDTYDYTFQSGTYSGTASLDLRKYTDRLGGVTLMGYDAERRTTSKTDPSSHMQSVAYYADGVPHTLTDENSHVTTWTRDIQGRPTSKTFADSTTESYAYDSATGLLASVTDALAQTKTIGYDAANEITSLSYSNAADGGALSSTPNVAFTWGAYFPRREQMTDGIGTTTWSYKAPGSNGALQLDTEDGPYSNDALVMAYDADGRPTSATVGGTTAETWSYDAMGRVYQHVTKLADYRYTGYENDSNRPEFREDWTNAAAVAEGWLHAENMDYAVLRKTYTDSSQARNFGSWYEIAGGQFSPYYLPTTWEENGGASGHPWPARVAGFTFDSNYRMTGAQVTCTLDDGGACATTLNYTSGWDPAGNQTTITPVDGTSSSFSQSYTNANTLSGGSYAFDSDGERTADGTFTYTWDAEHRLVKASQTGTSNTTTFSYDGLGRRLQSAYDDGSTTTNSRYQWCPPFPTDKPFPWANVPHICAKRDGSDTVLKRYYVEGEFTVSGSGKQVYQRDQIGSVRDIIDPGTGNLTGAVDYSPFGGQQRTWGTLTDYGYAGLFVDSPMGVVFSASRAYDGTAGAWLSRDPIAEKGGVNLFAYSSGNPVTRTDASGLEDTPSWVGGQTSMPMYGPWLPGPNVTLQAFGKYFEQVLVFDGFLAWGGGMASWGTDVAKVYFKAGNSCVLLSQLGSTDIIKAGFSVLFGGAFNKLDQLGLPIVGNANDAMDWLGKFLNGTQARQCQTGGNCPTK